MQQYNFGGHHLITIVLKIGLFKLFHDCWYLCSKKHPLRTTKKNSLTTTSHTVLFHFLCSIQSESDPTFTLNWAGDAIYCGEKIYLFGGSEWDELQSVQRYDITTDQWDVMDLKMPAPLRGHRVMIVNMYAQK